MAGVTKRAVSQWTEFFGQRKARVEGLHKYGSSRELSVRGTFRVENKLPSRHVLYSNSTSKGPQYYQEINARPALKG
jgi:hypothetical protein